jgi:hypothetical protein
MSNRDPLLAVSRQIARSMRAIRHLLVATLALTGLIACGSSTVGGGYNATTPTNVLEESLFDQLDSNVVVIASVNLGGPSRNYLKKRESFVDSRVQEYLEDAGFAVRPQREFAQRWSNAILFMETPLTPPLDESIKNRLFKLYRLCVTSLESKPISPALSLPTSSKKIFTTSRD